MLQFLVVDWAKVDVSFKGFPAMKRNLVFNSKTDTQTKQDRRIDPYTALCFKGNLHAVMFVTFLQLS